MTEFIYKYRYHIIFGVLLFISIGLFVGSAFVPILIAPAAATLAGALGMLAQSLNKHDLDESAPPKAMQPVQNDANRKRSKTIDSHDVNNSYVVNNNGPILYMYQRTIETEGQLQTQSQTRESRLALV